MLSKVNSGISGARSAAPSDESGGHSFHQNRCSRTRCAAAAAGAALETTSMLRTLLVTSDKRRSPIPEPSTRTFPTAIARDDVPLGDTHNVARQPRTRTAPTRLHFHLHATVSDGGPEGPPGGQGSGKCSIILCTRARVATAVSRFYFETRSDAFNRGIWLKLEALPGSSPS